MARTPVLRPAPPPRPVQGLQPLPRVDLYGESVDSALAPSILDDFLSGLSIDELSGLHLVRPEVVEATIRDQLRDLPGMESKVEAAEERAEAAEESALARLAVLRKAVGDARVEAEKIVNQIEESSELLRKALEAEKEAAK